MKKIVLIGSLEYGGADRQMVVLAKALVVRGYQVSILNSGRYIFNNSEIMSSNIPLVSGYPNRFLNKIKLRIPQLVYSLWRFVRKEKIEVGISFLGECNFANCVVAMLTHGKFRAITGLRNARTSLLLSRRELFYTKFEKYAFAKVCNSTNGLNLYKSNFPMLANKLKVIYNIIDLPEIKSDYHMRDDGKTHLIVPASYREVKNPYRLIEALSLINKREKSLLCIHWYGENHKGKLPYYLKLADEVEKRGLSDVLELNDATKQIAERMNTADVVALFSTSEGLPNAICEGMMLGKPILMTRVSDYDVLVDNRNGVLCDWNNPVSIKEALLAVINWGNEELRTKGSASKQKAIKLFSNQSAIQKWEEII